MNKLIFEEKIYTYHIDFVGHVNNVIYIQWMENGRMRLLEAIGLSVTDLALAEGVVPIITETSISYKKPLFLKNSVLVKTWISKINNASIIIEFRFCNEKDELCATGKQKALFINRKSMKPARLTEMYQKAFEQYLLPFE